MKGFRRGLALLAVAAALVVGLAACGGGGDGDSGSEPTTYQNAIYGFELTYNDPLSQTKSTPSGIEKYAVAFADKKGAELNDNYVNGVRVSVSELEASVKPAEVRKMKDDMAKIMGDMVTENDGEQIGEVEAVEIGGLPGYVIDFTVVEDGEKVRQRMTYLFRKNLLFEFNEQALVGDWDSLEPALVSVTQSFTLD